MAAVKKFFFDGENIREEKSSETGHEKEQAIEKTGGAEKGSSALKSGEMRMLVSSLLEKNGRRYARVSFLRGEDTAEGIVPDCRIEHVKGFTEEETAGLKFYLLANKDAIMAQAKQIHPLTDWLKK